MYYVYVLQSKVDGSLYVGYSNDLKRRLVEHNTGANRSTKHKAPFQLVYYEAYRNRADAKFRESQLKRHANAWKELRKRIASSIHGEVVRGL